MSLPDLSGLSFQPWQQLHSNSEDGVYCLDRVEDLSKCTSSIVLIRDGANISEREALELETYMKDDNNVPPTPNQMGPHPILRKQATFGVEYNFSKQKNTMIPGPKENWPSAVQKVLMLCKGLAKQSGDDPEVYNGVHTNWYPSGKSGVDWHSDREDAMIAGLPIYSVTLLLGEKVPRDFAIGRDPNTAEMEFQQIEFEKKYAKSVQRAIEKGKVPPKKEKFKPSVVEMYRISLGNGDILIMKGAMQQLYKHEVPKVYTKKYANARRINMTVRAFHSHLFR